MTGTHKLSNDQRKRLFEVYYSCCYGRAVAMELSEHAGRVNRKVTLLTLACIAGSLLTGSIAFFAEAALRPFWAALNIASVIAAMWAAIMSYSQKEFEYDSLASRFQELALAIEHFSQYAVYSDKHTGEEIDASASDFHLRYGSIISRTRSEYKRYDDLNEERINGEVTKRIPPWLIVKSD